MVGSSTHADRVTAGRSTHPSGTCEGDATVVIGGASDDARPAVDLSEGAKLGRFVILEQIGAGAMGRVLRGYDPKLQREVALKLVRTSSTATTQRMLREAQAMAQLSHPNVVPVYDVGEHENEIFIAMEYVQGRTLREWCKDERPGWRIIVNVFREAGQGLAAAHRVGLIHRDFKPDNVLVGLDETGRDRAGRVRVMDFGLARAMDDRLSDDDVGAPTSARPDLSRSGSSSTVLTEVGTVLGTPAYMAPEQHRGLTTDARSDQFAFCVALYEALYGRRPFEGTTPHALGEAKERGELRPLASDVPAVPRWVRRAVVRGLSPDPSARWPSVEALVDELGRDLGRTRARWAGAAVVGAAAVAFAFVARRGELCAGGSQQLAGMWDPDRRTRVETAMLSTQVSHAADTWARVGEQLDAYASRWVDTHTSTCEATRKHGEQSQAVMDARMRCLQSRRRDLTALVDMLEHADAEVVHKAIEAVAELPAIERCDDIDYVLAQVPPPDDPQVHALVEEVREQIARASALESAGKYAEGLRVARSAHDDALRSSYAPVVAEAAFRLGHLFEHTGSYDEAVQALRAAYFEGRRSGMDEVAARAATTLVFVLGERLARYEDAFAWGDHAEAEVARFGTDPMRADLLDQLAAIHRAVGDLERAQELFARALSINEASLGLDHSATGISVMGLALVLGERGELDEAQRLHERALSISETAFGPEHPTNAFALINLGGIAWSRGNLTEAQELYERALGMQEAALGPDHPMLSGALINLGNVHARRGRPEDARRLYARALEITEAALGEDHPSAGTAVLGLAIVHFDRGEFQRARAMYARALSIQENALGADHPSLATVVNNLANVHYELGELEEAHALYERSLALNERAYGPDHHRVAGSLKNLAWSHWKAGRLEEARPPAERALELNEKTLGPDHPEVAASAIIVAEIALSQGQPAAPIPLLERALASLGRDAPPELLAEVRFVLARALWDAPSASGRDRPRSMELAELALEGTRAIAARPTEIDPLQRWLAARRRAR